MLFQDEKAQVFSVYSLLLLVSYSGDSVLNRTKVCVRAEVVRGPWVHCSWLHATAGNLRDASSFCHFFCGWVSSRFFSVKSCFSFRCWYGSEKKTGMFWTNLPCSVLQHSVDCRASTPLVWLLVVFSKIGKKHRELGFGTSWSLVGES